MAATELPAEEEESVQKPALKFDALEYLKRTLSRQPGDLLKIFPMHARDSFRVNWYAHRAAEAGAMPGLNITYIRESKFLFCRLNAEGAPEITYPARQ